MRERHDAIDKRFACSPEAVIFDLVEQFPTSTALGASKTYKQPIPGVDVLGEGRSISHKTS
jgi:hypothetical protein